jgi:hypothetical protein
LGDPKGAIAKVGLDMSCPPNLKSEKLSGKPQA